MSKCKCKSGCKCKTCMKKKKARTNPKFGY